MTIVPRQAHYNSAERTQWNWNQLSLLPGRKWRSFFSLLAKTSTRDTRSSLFKFSRLLYHVSQSLRGLATAHYIRGASKEEFVTMFFFNLCPVHSIFRFFGQSDQKWKNQLSCLFIFCIKNPHFAWKWHLIFLFFGQTKNAMNPTEYFKEEVFSH